MLSVLRRTQCPSNLARQLVESVRHASTSTSPNPYPYPSHPHPTPHQIFHLPRSATVDQAKARYYELVRIYHPDSPVSRHLPPEKVQARFHAITSAYDALRGKTPLLDSGEPPHAHARRDYHDLSTAMWKLKQRRRADFGVGIVDDRWKDRILLSVVVLTIAAFVAQTYTTRRNALSSAAGGDRDTRVHARTSAVPRAQPTVELALAVDEDAKS